eukprot:102444_1
MMSMRCLLLFLIALSAANTIQNPVEKDAKAFMNRHNNRHLLATSSNYSIMPWCTDNNITCNTKNSNGTCEFYENFGNSCFSSYMVFGFGLSVFLIIPFLCLGCYCMNDVTTPLRVPTRILPVRKEY